MCVTPTTDFASSKTKHRTYDGSTQVRYLEIRALVGRTLGDLSRAKHKNGRIQRGQYVLSLHHDAAFGHMAVSDFLSLLSIDQGMT